MGVNLDAFWEVIFIEGKSQYMAKSTNPNRQLLAGQWWHTPLIPALGRQRQADFSVQGQPDLQSEFQDSQGCLGKKKLLLAGLKGAWAR